MLTGLIFATEDAADAGGALAATLPFGGATLIEYQARLLIAAGAGQVLIAVARVTPELLGAAARVRKRGVAVDVVRSAAEAAAKVHPLAHVVVVADGLVTSEAMLTPFGMDGGDLLLVTERDPGMERIDAGHFWGGLARITAQRLAEAAQMPRDYDFLSTLLRVVAQHGPATLLLTAAAQAEGHGIERDARGLAKRGRGVFAALANGRVPWVERWLLAPVARLALPQLVARNVTPLALVAIAGAMGLGGAWAIWLGWSVSGLAAAVAGSLVALMGAMLASLRGDEGEAIWAELTTVISAALAVLMVGATEDRLSGSTTGMTLAAGVVIAAGLVERLRGPVRSRRWWASPAAYPLLLLPFAALGQGPVGLAALALYAALTLLGGIEDVREGLAAS